MVAETVTIDGIDGMLQKWSSRRYTERRVEQVYTQYC